MKFALLGAAALAASALVTPAMAQPVVSDPGYCAQFYPNANCQNLGPGNPYTDSYYPGGFGNHYAYMGHTPRSHHRHYRYH
jgi:PAB1-binding protein PBP1